MTFDIYNFWIGLGRDPRNDIGLIKVKWPPLGHKTKVKDFKKGTKSNSEDEKRKQRRNERLLYREKIATPVCLTHDPMNLTQDSTQGLVSGD